jgi:peptidoglycan/xylan/chitin deacetylase (PgdA/CDA1 family)
MIAPLPLVVGAAALAGGGALVHQAAYGVRNQWLGATDWHGDPSSQSVALTFDDGPSDDTAPILDILAARGVRATFFMVGRQVDRFPALARRVVDEGHTVGNHSYSHPIYLYHSARRAHDELARTQDVIGDATGLRPVWSRPPAGVRTPGYFRACRALGLRTIQWSVAGFDWHGRPAVSIAHHVSQGIDAGGIILLHDATDHGGPDGRAETVAALPAVLDAAASRGLSIAPLSLLLARESHVSDRLS